MARKTALTSVEQLSEINLTPLMDLTFILLITFIITFPLIEQGIPVNLPKGEASELTSQTARTITLTEEGEVYLDDARVSRGQLAAEMTALGRMDPEVTVMLRADERLDYGSVVDVLRILHGANITRTALVTQAEES